MTRKTNRRDQPADAGPAEAADGVPDSCRAPLPNSNVSVSSRSCGRARNDCAICSRKLTYTWAPLTRASDEFRAKTQTSTTTTRHFCGSNRGPPSRGEKAGPRAVVATRWETDNAGLVTAEYTLSPQPYGNHCSLMASTKLDQVESFTSERNLLVQVSSSPRAVLSKLLPDMWPQTDPESRSPWSR